MGMIRELRFEKERRRTAVETDTLSTLSLIAKILFWSITRVSGSV